MARELSGTFYGGSAADVNNAGEIAGSVSLRTDVCNETPVVWTSLGASMTPLPVGSNRTDGYVTAIINSHMAAGFTHVCNYFRQAVVWYPNSPGYTELVLPRLIGEQDSVATPAA